MVEFHGKIDIRTVRTFTTRDRTKKGQALDAEFTKLSFVLPQPSDDRISVHAENIIQGLIHANQKA